MLIVGGAGLPIYMHIFLLLFFLCFFLIMKSGHAELFEKHEIISHATLHSMHETEMNFLKWCTSTKIYPVRYFGIVVSH